MELSTGYMINNMFVNGVSYGNIIGDKSPGVSYDSLIFSQGGIINNVPNGTKLVIGYTPYNHVNVVFGVVNKIVANNTTLSKIDDNTDNSLKPGESAITNTYNYNYTLQTKLDQITAIFKNDNGTFYSQLLISQGIIKILQDILNEYTNIANAINNHTHSSGSYNASSSGQVSGSSGVADVSTYTPTARLTDNDLPYISGDNPKCYVNDSGAYLT